MRSGLLRESMMSAGALFGKLFDLFVKVVYI